MSASSLLRPIVPVLLLALAGCAQLFPKSDAPSGAPEEAPPPVVMEPPVATEPPVSAPPVAGCPDGGCAQVPRQRNLTGLPTLLLAGESSAGAYWSFGLKTTYSFDAQGHLTLLAGDDAEPLIDHSTPAADAEECRAWGSAYNQRTTWFPDTAIFVDGGTLTGVRRGSKSEPRRVLTASGKGARTVTVRHNPKATEYWRVPCVGAQRVKGGWRTDALLAGGDRLIVRPAKGKEIVLRIPAAPAPYMLLAYSDSGRPSAGAITAVPMRVVLATVDVAQRRLVLQWQATAAREPTVHDAAWALTVPEDGRATLPEARRAFAGHVAEHLARCPLPKTPMNECAAPARALKPDIIDALMR